MPISDLSKPVDFTNLRVGVVHWKEPDPTASVFSRSIEQLGCQPMGFLYNSKLPEGLDVIFATGPFGSLVPVANQILALPYPQRPVFVLVLSEQFPDPDIPEWFRYWGGLLRTQIERMAYRNSQSTHWQVSPWLKWITTKGFRYRYYGDLWWLKRQGILSILIISSKWTSEFLKARGFDSLVLPLSYLPDKYDNLELERDVPVLWLGKTGSARRGRILKKIREELRAHGVEMLIIDGVENPYVYGIKLIELLYRTKIALNLLRADWDDNSARYQLVAPRRALIVGEPTLPHTDFLPGIHRIEAPIDKLSETILYYLNHEEERVQIVNRAYQLITSYSPIDQLRQILEKVVIIKKNNEMMIDAPSELNF